MELKTDRSDLRGGTGTISSLFRGVTNSRILEKKDRFFILEDKENMFHSHKMVLSLLSQA